MIDIFHTESAAEIQEFYSAIIPQITQAQAVRLRDRLRSTAARNITSAEREARYRKYCNLLEAVKRGDTAALFYSWETQQHGGDPMISPLPRKEESTA